MAKTATKRRHSKANIGSYLVLSVLVLIITALIWLQGRGVQEKIDVYEAQQEALDAQIASEEERSEEISEFEKYVQTKAYAEEQAHEKLGLVNEGEIVFQLEK